MWVRPAPELHDRSACGPRIAVHTSRTHSRTVGPAVYLHRCILMVINTHTHTRIYRAAIATVSEAEGGQHPLVCRAPGLRAVTNSDRQVEPQIVVRTRSSDPAADGVVHEFTPRIAVALQPTMDSRFSVAHSRHPNFGYGSCRRPGGQAASHARPGSATRVCVRAHLP